MKTVLVTGGNRGIGFEVCKQLDKLGYLVILGSRNLESGQNAAKTLSNNVIVKELDVLNENSINNLFKYINTEIGKLDVLVNNAGLGAVRKNKAEIFGVKKLLKSKFKGSWETIKKLSPFLQKTGIFQPEYSANNVPLSEVMKIMDTNFYGPWRMIQMFIPLLSNSNDARIINVSSGMGMLNSLSGIYPGYSLSKSSLNALTIMFSKELKEKNIKVNAICPGWVKTDMGGPDAPKTVEQGADTIIWLVTEKNIESGFFFQERLKIDW